MSLILAGSRTRLLVDFAPLLTASRSAFGQGSAFGDLFVTGGCDLLSLRSPVCLFMCIMPALKGLTTIVMPPMQTASRSACYKVLL